MSYNYLPNFRYLLIYFSLIFPLFVVIGSTSLSGQVHFPQDSAVWKIRYDVLNPPNWHNKLIVYEYEAGDTLVNGEKYSILTTLGNGSRVGSTVLVKVDTILNKVFIRPGSNRANCFPNGNQQDYLLYSFDHAVGDTVPILNCDGLTVPWEVLKVDSILINGSPRKYMDMHVRGFSYVDRWVEGVGSLHELFAPMLEPSGFFETRFDLVCFEAKKNAYQYNPGIVQDTNTYNCEASVSIDNISTLDYFISVYPNPANDYLEIENKSHAKITVEIFDLSGNNLLSSKIVDQKQARILDLRNLGAGLYILLIRGGDIFTSDTIIKL